MKLTKKIIEDIQDFRRKFSFFKRCWGNNNFNISWREWAELPSRMSEKFQMFKTAHFYDFEENFELQWNLFAYIEKKQEFFFQSS